MHQAMPLGRQCCWVTASISLLAVAKMTAGKLCQCRVTVEPLLLTIQKKILAKVCTRSLSFSLDSCGCETYFSMLSFWLFVVLNNLNALAY